MATETCSVCRATVVIEREVTDVERLTFLCEDCHSDRMFENERHDLFMRHELPKFKQIIGELEEELITVDDFFCKMAELVESF